MKKIIMILTIASLLLFLMGCEEKTTDPDTTSPTTSITSGPSGTIDYDDVTFIYTGCDNEANLVFSYRLIGFDSNWSDDTIDTSISYSNLPDGSYTFEVRAKDEAGNVDSSPASRSFTVDVEVISTNVALMSNGASATAISEGTYMGDTQYAYEAIDGDENIGWSSNWDIPAWLQVEFNQVYDINSIGVWWGTHQHDFTISLSINGNDWTSVVTGTSNNSEGGSPVYELFSISNTNAKYMKIDIITTSAPGSHIFQASVDEIEAFCIR